MTLPEVMGPTLDATLAMHPAVVVHFWARWAGQDRIMCRNLEAIRGRFAGRAAFFACDVDREENSELCRRLRVVNVPWVAVFAHGIPQERIVGNREPDALAAEIEARLGRAAWVRYPDPMPGGVAELGRPEAKW